MVAVPDVGVKVLGVDRGGALIVAVAYVVGCLALVVTWVWFAWSTRQNLRRLLEEDE